jgi:purine nucleosidase
MSIPVIHDHDGHVDDLLTCLLLWLAPEIDLQAIGISKGNCYVDQAFQSMLKIATFLDLEGAEISLSEEETAHQFPETWRRESFIVNELPLFRANDLKKPYAQGRPRRSQVVFQDCLNHSKAPITIVTTGPLTNIANLFRQQAILSDKVKEFVIVGGALTAPGNVEEEGADGLAEWNIYSDPSAFKTILETKVPIRLIPLDATTPLAVGSEFLRKLSAQAENRMASKLAAALWSIVKSFQTHFCDMLAAASLIKPELLQFKEARIDVSSQGKNAGRISTAFWGRKVQVASKVDQAGLEELILSTLNSR